MGKFDDLRNAKGQFVSQKAKIEAFFSDKFKDISITPKIDIKGIEAQLNKQFSLNLDAKNVSVAVDLDTTVAEKKLSGLLQKITDMGKAIQKLPSINIPTAGVSVGSGQGKQKQQKKGAPVPPLPDFDKQYSFRNAFQQQYGISPKNLSQAIKTATGTSIAGKGGIDLQMSLESVISDLYKQAQDEAIKSPKSIRAKLLNELGGKALAKLVDSSSFYKGILGDTELADMDQGQLIEAFKSHGFKTFRAALDSQRGIADETHTRQRENVLDKLEKEIQSLGIKDLPTAEKNLRLDLYNLDGQNLSPALQKRKQALESLLQEVQSGSTNISASLQQYMDEKAKELTDLKSKLYVDDSAATKALSVSNMQSVYTNELVNKWTTLQDAKAHIAKAMDRQLQDDDLEGWTENASKLRAIAERQKDPYASEIKKHLDDSTKLESLLKQRRAAQDMIFGADSTDQKELDYLKSLQPKIKDSASKQVVDTKIDQLIEEINKTKTMTSKELVQYYQDLLNEARKGIAKKANTGVDITADVSDFITLNSKMASAKQDTGKLGYNESALAMSAMAQELDDLISKGNKYSSMLRQEAQANTDLFNTIRNNTDALKSYAQARSSLGKNIMQDIQKNDLSSQGQTDSMILAQKLMGNVQSEISEKQSRGLDAGIGKYATLFGQYSNLYRAQGNEDIASLYATFAQELADGSNKIKNATKSTLQAEQEIANAVAELKSDFESGKDTTGSKQKLDSAIQSYSRAFSTSRGRDITPNEIIRALNRAGGQSQVLKGSDTDQYLSGLIAQYRQFFGTSSSGFNAQSGQINSVNGQLEKYEKELERIDEQMSKTTDTKKLKQLERQYSNLLHTLIEYGREQGKFITPGQISNYTRGLVYNSQSANARTILNDASRYYRRSQNDLDRSADPNNSLGVFQGLAYFGKLIGRASKGTGSAFEASSILFTDSIKAFTGTLSGVTKALGVVGMILGGTSAGLTAWLASISASVSALKTIVGILQTVGEVFYQFLAPGIELYKSVTKATSSMSAAIATNATLNGQKLSKLPIDESLDYGYSASKMLQRRAQMDAELSAFSYQEIIDSLSGTLPMLMAKGMSVEQAYQTNMGVASVAKLLNLAPNQVLQETRDLAQGSITAGHSQVANALKITNQDLAGKTADEIFQYFVDAFSRYEEVLKEYAATPVGAFEQMQERLQSVAMEFVDHFAWTFKGLFDTITDLTGTWVDSEGNKLKQIIDPKTGRQKNVWAATNIAADGSTYETYKDSPEGVPHFELSDVLEELMNSLDGILEHLAQAMDTILNYAQDLLGITDPIGQGSEAIDILIDAAETLILYLMHCATVFLDNVDTIDSFITGCTNLGLGIIALGTNIKNFGDVLVDVGQLIWDIIRQLAKVLTGDLSGAKAIHPWDAFVNRFTEDTEDMGKSLTRLVGGEVDGKKYYASSFSDFRKDILNNKKDGYFSKLVQEGILKGNQAKQAQANREKSGFSLGSLKGNTEQKEDEKAKKAAIQAENKAYNAHVAELKEALEKHIQELKDLSEQNDIAYKEGFKSYNDYTTQRMAYLVEENRAKVEELEQERALLNSRTFGSDDEKTEALAKNGKELEKANATLEKSLRAQSEITNYLSQSARAMASTSGAIQSIIENAANVPTFNPQTGAMEVSSGVADFTELMKIVPNTLESIKSWAMTLFQSQGFSKEQSAAILGNLQVESTSLNPKDTNGSHWGIAQWDENRWAKFMNFAQENNSDPYDVRTQLIYVVQEMQNMGFTFQSASDDLIASAQEFRDAFERPGVEPQEIKDKLYAYAKEALDYTPFVKRVSTATVGTGMDANAGIQKALDNGLLNQTLEHGTVACVEAIDKIGAYIHPMFKEALDKGIVNTDVLEGFLSDKGVQDVEYAKDRLEPGDVIFFDKGDVRNQHVMFYQGNNMLAGNFSSKNGGQGAVGQQDVDSYMQYSGLKPKHIMKTSALMSGSKTAIPNVSYDLATTEESHKVRDELISASARLLETASSATNDILGTYSIDILKIKNNYAKKKNEAGITDYEKDLLDTAEIGEIQKLVFSKVSEIIDFDLSNYEHNIDLAIGKIKFQGNYDYTDLIGTYTKYFSKLTDVKNMAVQTVSNQLKTLEQLFGEAERAGRIQLAANIRDKIKASLSKLESLYSKVIEAINASFDFMQTQFDNGSWTDLQREQGNKELKAYRNAALAKAYQKQEDDMMAVYNSKVAEYESITEQAGIAKRSGDLETYNKLMDESRGILQTIDATATNLQKNHWALIQAQDAAKLKDIWEEAGDVFKQSLEDALVDGMTDGINAVIEGSKTIGDVFRDMATSILKTLQSFFAKKIVTSLMNNLFGNTSTKKLSEPGEMSLKAPQDKSVADGEVSINADIGAVDANPPSSMNVNSATITISNATINGANPKSTIADSAVTAEVAEPGVIDNQNVTVTNQQVNAGQMQATVGSESSTVASQSATVGSQTATVGTSTSTVGMETSTVGAETSTVGTESSTVASETSTVASQDATIMNSNSNSLSGFATGGFISGPGSATSDSIPAMLSDGEYVINAASVKRYGTNFLNAVNDGTFARIHPKVQKFADGGAVRDATSSVGSGMANTFGTSVGQSISNTANFNVALVRDESEAMSQFMRSPSGQKIMLDFSRKYASVTRRF